MDRGQGMKKTLADNLSTSSEPEGPRRYNGHNSVDDDIILSPKEELSQDSETTNIIDDDIMEIQEIEISDSEENGKDLSTLVQRLTRKELEDLALKYSIESLSNHVEDKKLRMTKEKLETQTEEIALRITHLKQQVIDMGRGIKAVVEARNNNRVPNRKDLTVVKHRRSVGVQVTVEPSLRQYPANNVVPAIKDQDQVINALNKLKVDTSAGRSNNLSDEDYARIVDGLIQNFEKETETKVGERANKNGNVDTNYVIDLTDEDDANVCGQGITKSSKTAETAIGEMSPTLNSSCESVQSNAAGQMVSQVAQKPSPPVSGEISSSTSTEAHSGTSQVTIKSPPLVTNDPPKSMPESIFEQPCRSSTVENVVPPADYCEASPKITTACGKTTPTLPPATRAAVPNGVELKKRLPRPSLKVIKEANEDGVNLIWDMAFTSQHSEPKFYEIFVCQESFTGIASAPVNMSDWKQVGTIHPLPLPMSCKLSAIVPGNRYFFVVRASDCHGRSSPFSNIGQIFII